MKKQFKKIFVECVRELLNDYINLSSKLKTKSWTSFIGKTIGRVNFGMQIYKDLSRKQRGS